MTLYTEKIVKKRTTISFVEFQLFSKQIYLRKSVSKFFCLILIYLFFFIIIYTKIYWYERHGCETEFFARVCKNVIHWLRDIRQNIKLNEDNPILSRNKKVLCCFELKRTKAKNHGSVYLILDNCVKMSMFWVDFSSPTVYFLYRTFKTNSVIKNQLK